MKDRLATVLNHLINEDREAATAELHDAIVEMARGIRQGILKEDENLETSELEDEIVDDEVEADAEIQDVEDELEDHIEDDLDIEDRLEDVEAQIAELQAQFDAEMADDEDVSDEVVDDEVISDDDLELEEDFDDLGDDEVIDGDFDEFDLEDEGLDFRTVDEALEEEALEESVKLDKVAKVKNDGSATAGKGPSVKVTKNSPVPKQKKEIDTGAHGVKIKSGKTVGHTLEKAPKVSEKGVSKIRNSGNGLKKVTDSDKKGSVLGKEKSSNVKSPIAGRK